VSKKKETNRSRLLFPEKIFIIFIFSLIIFLPSTAVRAMNPCECCCPDTHYSECEPNGAYEATDCASASCCEYCSTKGQSSDDACTTTVAGAPAATIAPTTSSTGTTWEKAEKIYYLLEAPIGNTLYVEGIAEYIALLYNLASSAAAIIAVVVIMFGGFMWATSAGNEQRITSAKETIISAVVGLILVLGSFVILNFINPQLVSLGGLDILKIPLSDIPADSAPYIACNWTTSVIAEQAQQVKSDESACTGTKPTASSQTTDEELDAPEGGDATDYVYDCYCSSMGALIVSAAKQHASAKDLGWNCCWGWVNAVYDSVLAAPQSAGSTNVTEIYPGDWLYVNNGNTSSADNLHSVIFLGWTNQTEAIGQCVGASPNSPAISTCNLKSTPVTQIYHPVAKKTKSTANPGICGGQSDLTKYPLKY